MRNNFMKKKIRLLFLGDLQGEPGIAIFKKWVPILKDKHKVDAVIVNGENSAKNGKGITPEIVKDLKEYGATVITSGNHIWGNKKISLAEYPTCYNRCSSNSKK